MTGPTDVFAAAARLYRDGVPFVLATVVRAERPTSARPGAKAIVTGDGQFRGFVGGTCVKPAVRRESLRALADGAPRLLRISPESPPEGVEAEEGVLEEHMACVSGGALDIHLEPYLPSRRLLLAGRSPIVESLAALGEALGMEVRTAETEEDLDTAAEGAFVVVAGHGEGEWGALKAALTGGRARYAGLVASPRRAAAVRERLVGMGVAEADIGRLRSPAGLDIGAETPGEIALSILAQIVEERRAAEPPEAAAEEPAAPAVGISLDVPDDDVAVDPICGMSVSRDSPHRVESGGETWWFCCAGCAETFATAAQAADSA
ncbi:MAG: XdhC family protein [Acidobacteriota bacterium]|nr:XdhC family protein [Acidobacteriota bacterium]